MSTCLIACPPLGTVVRLASCYNTTMHSSDVADGERNHICPAQNMPSETHTKSVRWQHHQRLWKNIKIWLTACRTVSMQLLFSKDFTGWTFVQYTRDIVSLNNKQPNFKRLQTYRKGFWDSMGYLCWLFIKTILIIYCWSYLSLAAQHIFLSNTGKFWFPYPVTRRYTYVRDSASYLAWKSLLTRMAFRTLSAKKHTK